MTKRKIYYTVYQITNKLNGKIYVGCHKTRDLDDGYMGSGKRIIRAIKRYGEENFSKEILYLLESTKAMYVAEKSIVNAAFLKRKDVYNLTEGGHGSWAAMNNRVKARKAKNKKAAIAMNKTMWSDPKFAARKKKEASERFRKLHAEGKIKPYDWTGKKHKKATKKKIGKANAKHQKGKGNSQYGKVWIYSEVEKKSIRIDKDEILSWLKKGWIKGRKMKFN